MKRITNLLTFASMLECVAIIGICGSYELGRIETAELLKWFIALGAALYITSRLIKVSAAVTANNSRRKRMVNHSKDSTVISIPHKSENVKCLRTNRNGV